MMQNASSQRDWFEVMERMDAGGEISALVEIERLIRNQLLRRRGAWSFVSHEDLVQDVLIDLVRAWRSHRIREPERFPGFVRTLANRRLVDALGRERRVWALSSSQGSGLDLETFAPSGMEVSDLALDARRAIGKLDFPSRCALEAVYRDGWTYEEAARRLGLPLGTFKRRIARALRVLRANLAGLGFMAVADGDEGQANRLAS
jgi:RNA polymerase sigma-70 factor, ECF subfamily